MNTWIIAAEPSASDRMPIPGGPKGVLSADLAAGRVKIGQALEQGLPAGPLGASAGSRVESAAGAVALG
jgi:hypothetical protein